MRSSLEPSGGVVFVHARSLPRRWMYIEASTDLHPSGHPGCEVSECHCGMQDSHGGLLPNKVGQVQREGCVEVTSCSQHWPCMFPQHGRGPKHLRPIVLEPWQRWVAIERHPKSLLRGLIHSDGCRATNTIKAPSGTYSYPRYQFSNRSAEIRAIFTLACERVRIECRPSNAWTVSVSKMSEVARMDEFVGPKT